MNTIEMPSHLLILRDEAQRLLDVLITALDAPTTPTLVENFNNFTASSCIRLAENAGQLTDIFNGPLNEIATHPAGDIAAVYRATGRIEQLLLQFASDRQAVCGLIVDPEYDEEKRLLASGHMHAIRDIRHALQRMMEIFDNPQLLLDKHDPPADGHIELSIDLTFTAPPEFPQLAARMKDRATSWSPLVLSDPSSYRKFGVLGGIGKFAIGIAAFNALLGDQCND